MKHCAGCELMLGANDIEQCERILRLRKNVFINTALSSDEMYVFRAQPFIFEHLSNGHRRKYVPAGASPLCGNTIGQDRRFLAAYMPRLEAFFHYRNLDVSTLKELSRRWRPEVYASFKKQQKHTALADVHESIDELEHYRTHFLKL